MSALTATERELFFAVAFVIDAHLDLADQITAAQRDGISREVAAWCYRDLLNILRQTNDATSALSQLVNETERTNA